MGKQGKKKGARMINNIKKYIELGLSSRQIARAMGVSRNTVKKYVKDSPGGPNSRSKGSHGPYQAPWSSKVNWTDVRLKQSLGTQLAHYPRWAG